MNIFTQVMQFCFCAEFIIVNCSDWKDLWVNKQIFSEKTPLQKVAVRKAMYDLNTILKIFEENKFSMDYHKDFDVLKRILEYVDLNIKTLSKIQYKSGKQ